MLTKKRGLMAVICFCVVSSVISFIYLGGFEAGDLRGGHWSIIAYSLRGHDPYPLLGAPAIDPMIGQIPINYSQVPWALIFGAIFYAGFLPVGAAAIWSFALHFLLALALAYVIYKKFSDQIKAPFVLIIGAVLGNSTYWYSMNFGNYAAPIAMLTILAILYADEKPILGGVLMGLALMKPQISAIFGLVWLMKMNWKAILSAGTVVVLGWTTSAIVTGTSPITLLTGFLSDPTRTSSGYLGICTPLRLIGVSESVTMMLSMVAGALYVILLTYLIRGAKNPLVLYLPATIASCFWIFKNGCDYVIVLSAVFLVVMLLQNTNMNKVWLFLCLLYLELGMLVMNFVIEMVEYVPKIAIKSANGIILFGIGIFLTLTCRRCKKELFSV